LLGKRADVEKKDGKGCTALYQTALKGHDAIVKLLIENGASVETVERKGWKMLSKAASRGRESVVKLLVGNNVKIEAKERKGWGKMPRASAGLEDVIDISSSLPVFQFSSPLLCK
jgi:ankyrin repeat protein